jgi:TrpR family trp operon transcriptional repressor
MLDAEKVCENLDEMATVLAGVSDKALIADFFNDLFTPAERADMASRWALIKELNRKTPQRTIAKELGVSLCKITRGSKELRKPDSAFSRMLELLERTNAPIATENRERSGIDSRLT